MCFHWFHVTYSWYFITNKMKYCNVLCILLSVESVLLCLLSWTFVLSYKQCQTYITISPYNMEDTSCSLYQMTRSNTLIWVNFNQPLFMPKRFILSIVVRCNLKGITTGTIIITLILWKKCKRTWKVFVMDVQRIICAGFEAVMYNRSNCINTIF